MGFSVCIVGGGLAGSEAALQLGCRGIRCTLVEARPDSLGPVHKSGLLAELVCSNSLKGTKEDSAAGMLKRELDALGSCLYQAALATRIPSGGALAVDREQFAHRVTDEVSACLSIESICAELVEIESSGRGVLADGSVIGPFDAFILATGPLTSDALASWLECMTGSGALSFYDAAAPIVAADSLDYTQLFSQSRYEEGEGDYLNAALNREQYDAFANELVAARRVMSKDFEQMDLFQACQPIEEVARSGHDAPRYGALKPVGLVDPSTGARPWAAVQLRAEDADKQAYNLVGFQTNLTFSEQERVFRMIPGLEKAEFTRFGVMHRNTFLDAPRIMDSSQRIAPLSKSCSVPIFVAGQISGTEGYCEAMRSGLQAALSVVALSRGSAPCTPPRDTAYGALLAYATSPDTHDYQPMHVNFGIMRPLESPVRSKKLRRSAYAQRGNDALCAYVEKLSEEGMLS